MAYSVHLKQIIDIVNQPEPSDDNYTLESTFSNPQPQPTANWDGYFFLVKIIDPNDDTKDEYQNVCTVADIEKYSNSRATAVTNGDNYFRAITWTHTLSSLEAANAQAAAQQQGTQYLCNDWSSYVGTATFPNTVYDSDITSS